VPKLLNSTGTQSVSSHVLSAKASRPNASCGKQLLPGPLSTGVYIVVQTPTPRSRVPLRPMFILKSRM